jgi:PBP1b-binding outer membrane lipoprotein LpoB
MKKYNSILKYIFVVITALFITGCVHDDKYDAPNLDDYQCRNADYYVTGKGKELTKLTLPL